MEILEIKKSVKSVYKFECSHCDFKCCTKSDWDRHTLRAKHIFNVNGNKMEIKKSVKSVKNVFSCHCGKKYNTNSGLWKHQSKCDNMKTNENQDTSDNISSNITNLTNLICELVKTNTDIQKSVIELCKNGTTNNIINNNNINSNNKTFNLQVFLNETCKDAMNISDFVESVKLQVSDLENVGKVGYIEGISNIIIKNLQALDENKRPVHCTDQKREVMYVKDDNTWEKEDENNKKLRKAIRMIAHKNICMFKEFREKYPDCEEYDSNKNDQYNKIVYEAMGGKGDNDYEKDTKIIKKIAKNVIIDKNVVMEPFI
uniref:C2H2-type domain-containing protein n=1 Tax=viral metagenome TaxID=1070528 RepID=A0A6C0DJC0_9ZZZZ